MLATGLLRPAILALIAATACLVQAQTETDRLGLIGKEASKEFINNVVQLKYQVANNTNRISTLTTHIAENAGDTATLQEVADSNNVKILEQESLLQDIVNFIIDPVFPLAFTNSELYSNLEDVTLQTSSRVEQILAQLPSSLGRRLLQSEQSDERLVSPVAIETAKKCSEELAKLAAKILSNNASIYELEEAYQTNEANITILQSTVEENEAGIADIVAAISTLRAGLQDFDDNLLERASNITSIGFNAALPNIETVTDALNVSSVVSVSEVPASGGSLTAATVTASCGTNVLLGGGCYIDFPEGLILADLAPYIKESQGGPTVFASLSFPMTEDYSSMEVNCDLTVTSESATSPSSAYWEDAPFPLVFRAEALCYNEATPSLT
ncbi:hypothetical protein M9434_004708 [Picochlorum sp. BPE23]|nr:hypothetical protein M9434_004708 [Picochlorum sp. BPE23]